MFVEFPDRIFLWSPEGYYLHTSTMGRIISDQYAFNAAGDDIYRAEIQGNKFIYVIDWEGRWANGQWGRLGPFGPGWYEMPPSGFGRDGEWQVLPDPAPSPAGGAAGHDPPKSRPRARGRDNSPDPRQRRLHQMPAAAEGAADPSVWDTFGKGAQTVGKGIAAVAGNVAGKLFDFYQYPQTKEFQEAIRNIPQRSMPGQHEAAERAHQEAEAAERARQAAAEAAERVRQEAERARREERDRVRAAERARREERERERVRAAERARKKAEAAAAERVRQEAERARREAEAAERARKKAEAAAAERARKKAEAAAAERVRQEAERARQKAEAAERARQKAEAAERARQKAEAAERARREERERERVRADEWQAEENRQKPPPTVAQIAAAHLIYAQAPPGGRYTGQPATDPRANRARYRALARLYHPDKGGTTEQTQQLNDARDILKAAIPTQQGGGAKTRRKYRQKRKRHRRKKTKHHPRHKRKTKRCRKHKRRRSKKRRR